MGCHGQFGPKIHIVQIQFLEQLEVMNNDIRWECRVILMVG